MDKKKDLRRSMSEAAVLSRGDPQRQAIEAEIAREGDGAEQEWLDLLREDEQMRLELQRVPLISGLEERLLAIPDEIQRPRRLAMRWWMSGAVAALLALAVGIGLIHHLRRTSAFSERIQRIAFLAMDDHISAHPLVIETSDRSAMKEHLSARVHFPIKMPALPAEFELLGGRKCSIGAQVVAYTRWRRRQRDYSLFQFCPKNFDLPDAFPRRIITRKESGVVGEPCEVLIWAENGCAYAIVGESNIPLYRIIPTTSIVKEVVTM